tara:strand:+ start:835 stop:1713 length:879 start_codon:yes stop_codon:yes gene_type:complete
MLKLLTELFGKSYVQKMIGTRSNVTKPRKMDWASPYKVYSDEAFEDPKTIQFIEDKIAEYGPYAMSNKNADEIANFELNAKRLKQAKMKQAGVSENMIKAVEEAKKPKPQADVIDIGTGKKLDEEGIMTLKQRAPQTDEKSFANLKEDIAKLNKRNRTEEESLGDLAAKRYSANEEANRAGVVRSILLNDDRLNLPQGIKDALLGRTDRAINPLDVFNEVYKRDLNKLDKLDGLIFEGEEAGKNANKVANEFLEKDSFDLVEDDLGTKLKKADDDPDMPEMAKGGLIKILGV